MYMLLLLAVTLLIKSTSNTPERLYHLAVVSGAHFTLGTILIVILVSSGSVKSGVPPVCHAWLSWLLEGDGLAN